MTRDSEERGSVCVCVCVCVCVYTHMHPHVHACRYKGCRPNTHIQKLGRLLVESVDIPPNLSPTVLSTRAAVTDAIDCVA